MKQKYDIIYSIGRDCACAMYMKQANLRACSGPFDWLTNANFETRIDLILNDFQDFINKNDIIPLEKDPNMHNDDSCDYYQNIRNGFYYYHDFPTGVAISKSFPAVYAKYMRRIKRFYDNINKHNRILLIWFSHYHNTPDDVLLDASKRICKKFGKNIDLLIIEHADNIINPIKKQIADNIVKYNVHTMEFDDAGYPTTQGHIERVLPIFEQYKLKKSGRKLFLRIVSDIVVLFLPFSKKRGKIKQYIRDEI
jgi:hypothetical protein